MIRSVLGAAAFALVAVAGVVTPVAATTIATTIGSYGARFRYPAGREGVLPMTGAQPMRVHSLLAIRKPMRFGDYVWNDIGAPPTGKVRVRVDLPRQTISVFRDGHEIGTAVILYGTDHKPTPTGTFPILMRARQHQSSLYDAEMPYMLRLTNDGVAIHASSVRRGSATHGCIGVPLSFAQLLFDQVARGDLVTIVGT
ncbi:MAG: L,D-transpeptidase family protein [Sphingomonas phyllosphaerae]|uniref:L,D-transpeptidase family protein n=1 Tax=Sphingomonas phyllosphaerae TaxID=257003 RepID=UPI002FF783AA